MVCHGQRNNLLFFQLVKELCQPGRALFLPFRGYKTQPCMIILQTGQNLLESQYEAYRSSQTYCIPYGHLLGYQQQTSQLSFRLQNKPLAAAICPSWYSKGNICSNESLLAGVVLLFFLHMCGNIKENTIGRGGTGISMLFLRKGTSILTWVLRTEYVLYTPGMPQHMYKDRYKDTYKDLYSYKRNCSYTSTYFA